MGIVGAEDPLIQQINASALSAYRYSNVFRDAFPHTFGGFFRLRLWISHSCAVDGVCENFHDQRFQLVSRASGAMFVELCVMARDLKTRSDGNANSASLAASIGSRDLAICFSHDEFPHELIENLR